MYVALLLTRSRQIAFVDPIRVSAVWVEAKLCTAAGCYPKSATSAGTANKITSVKMSQDADATKETAQCSNRGICDGATGVCGCFAGFTGEACSLQTILV